MVFIYSRYKCVYIDLRKLVSRYFDSIFSIKFQNLRNVKIICVTQSWESSSFITSSPSRYSWKPGSGTSCAAVLLNWGRSTSFYTELNTWCIFINLLAAKYMENWFSASGAVYKRGTIFPNSLCQNNARKDYLRIRKTSKNLLEPLDPCGATVSHTIT